MSASPRKQVCDAFAQQVAAGIGVPGVHRNPRTPVDLATADARVVMIDGPEELKVESLTGLMLRRTCVTVQGFVKTKGGENPEDARDALLEVMRRAAISDRTLGGLLYGKLTDWYQFERQYFDGLEEGPTDFETIGEHGAEQGASFSQEFYLQYATPSDEPGRLVRLGEGDG